MSTQPPSFAPPARLETGAMPSAGRASFGQAAASTMSMKWAALQDVAGVVATMAGLEPERTTPEIRNFPALIRDATGWKRELADRGVDDLAAIMESGIAALLSVNARGADAAPAAMALWREFHAARSALLQLAPEAGALGPRRSA